jgi:ATP-dependent helicase/nuclease subunit A
MPGPSSQLENHVVQAGAGAGKTRSLVEKVVSVFRHYRDTEGRNPRMIVTTFTRKATQELRERLIVRACEVRDNELLEYVGNARSLHISTIHGVLNLFLSQVGHLCHLEAGFRLIHDTEEKQVARVAFKKALLSESENLLWMEEYSFAQLLSVLVFFSKAYSQDPLMRPASLADLEALHAISHEEWQAELKRIANRILNVPAGDPKWTAFAEELKIFAHHWDCSSDQLEAFPVKPRKSAKSPLTAEFQEEIAEELKVVKSEIDSFEENRELWPYFAKKWDHFFDLGMRFHKEFWHAKLNEGLLSLSDLEIFSLTVLRESPFLGGHFSAAWDFWLIDEYQDTSPIQAELLSRLKGKSPSFVVGDPQQSIYLFRGARSEIFNAKISEAKLEGNKVDQLLVNYRSDPGLLTFFNDFFLGLSDQFQGMQPRTAVSERKTVAHLISAPSKEEENQGILAHIFELLDKGARFEDICILGRTHTHLSELAGVLKEKAIPVQVHSPTGFWRRREILDAMALLKFLVHPHDNLTLLALLRSPGFRVADEELVDWMKSRPASLWSQIVKSELESIANLRELLELRSREGLVAAFENGLRTSGLLDLAYHSDPSGRREANLWKVFARIKEEERKPGFRVLNLVEEVEGLLGADEMTSEGDALTAAEPNCVNLMTIHSSKGLEFEHVILPRMGVAPNLTTSDTFSHHEESSLFTFPVYIDAEGRNVSSPLDRHRVRALRKREQIEQDRWLYVALTRAKQSLALTWSDDKLENGSWALRGKLITPERFAKSDQYAIKVCRPPFAQVAKVEVNEKRLSIREVWRRKNDEDEKRDKRDEGVERDDLSRKFANEPRAVTQTSKRTSDPLTVKQLIHRQERSIYGISLHRAFQTLKTRPDLAWAQRLHPEMDEALQFVWAMTEPNVREIIANGHVEWGFKVKTAKSMIQGRIDLWGKDQSGKIWIVDYKSGRAQDGEGYWDQLKLYAWALRRFGHQEDCELLLIHPTERKSFRRVFSPSDLESLVEQFG